VEMNIEDVSVKDIGLGKRGKKGDERCPFEP
jgi:hypothetical protein